MIDQTSAYDSSNTDFNVDVSYYSVSSDNTATHIGSRRWSISYGVMDA